MPETFLTYLRKERDRLDLALELARSTGRSDEITTLRQQRLIVEDQLASWTRDLSQDRIAA